jgi:hypothetical protein
VHDTLQLVGKVLKPIILHGNILGFFFVSVPTKLICFWLRLTNGVPSIYVAILGPKSAAYAWQWPENGHARRNKGDEESDVVSYTFLHSKWLYQAKSALGILTGGVKRCSAPVDHGYVRYVDDFRP